jgi:DNA-binding Lrp family transcriptional regulator
MIEAYVLILTDVGTGGKVGVEAGKVAGVKLSQVVTGPYDVVARVEAGDMDALGRLVDEIQKIKGVTRTLTCPILNL